MIDNEKTATPEQISFTDTDEAAMTRPRANLTGGKWYRFIVTGHKKDVTKKKDDGGGQNLRLRLTCSPLDANDQKAKLSTILDIYPPIANPAVPGHTAPNTKLGCYFFARSLDAKFPCYAKKQEGGKYKTTTGDVIDFAASRAVEKEVNKAIGQAAAKWWNDPASLVGEVFYGYVKSEVSARDGQTYTSIEKTRYEVPEDAEVVYENFSE